MSKLKGTHLMENTSLFQFLFIVIFGSAVLIGATHRRGAARAGAKAGDRLSRKGEGKVIFALLRGGGLVMWLGALAYAINPAWMAWSSIHLPDWLRLIGAAVGLAALPLIYWATRSIGSNVTDTVDIRREHKLVRHGAYRWVRHPLYALGATAFGAMGVLAANWFLLAAITGGVALLLARLPKEEAGLINRFGDEYRAYMARTPRFFPRLFRQS